MRKLIAAAATLSALLAVAPAHASLAQLKAACGAPQSPADAPALSYRFCDDGVPTAGGANPNPGGDRAVEVPAAYMGIEGGPEKEPLAALQVPGNSGGNVALDVDLTLPTVPPPPGGYPLVAMMHGCCSGNKTSWEATRIAEGGERWHYSNAWFASRGYVVLTYTSRGFVTGENRGSTGETQIDSLQFEMNDLQYLAGLLADDPSFNVNPQRVVATGGSYGGGFSWLALVDPIWRSPGGKEMRLAAVAPKYGWTDLVHSLVPTGAHFYDTGEMPATDGSDSGFAPPGAERRTSVGIPIRSIVAALFLSGRTGLPPGNHATFPQSVNDAFNCTQTYFPMESSPVCGPLLDTVLPDFIANRSAYYRNSFFAKVATDPAYRVPVYSAGTHTDPLFPPVEHHRMAARLRATAPDYPIQQYFGDYQHFVQNKGKEWGDICGTDRHVCRVDDYPGGDLNTAPAGRARIGTTTMLNQFVDYYARPPANPTPPQPAFDVTASLQVCPQNATGGQRADEPGPTFTAPTYAALTPGQVNLSFPGTATTTSKAGANAHAANSEPVSNSVSNGGRCPVETGPPGAGVAVYDSPALPSDATMIGGGLISVDYTATTGSGLLLAARLYDVFPDGRAVLVDRGPRRLREGVARGRVRFQIHGNGWRFERGHRIRLELAQDDDPYLKSSDVPSSITLANFSMQLPLRETTYGRADEPIGAVADTFLPSATMLAPRLASDVSRTSRFRIRWRGADIGRGISRFRVQVRRTSGRRPGRWHVIRGLGATRRTSGLFRGRRGQTYRFRVRAVDGAGNRSQYHYDTTIVPLDERTRGLRFRGPWRRSASRGAYGRRQVACRSRRCVMSLRYRGGSLLLVGTTGPRGGRAVVSLDGRRRTVSFRSARRAVRRVVFAATRRRGRHRLTVRVRGGGTVAIDAVGVGRRR